MALFFACLAPAAAHAQGDYGNSDPWSVSAFVGPFTTKYAGAVVQSFNMHPTATLAGVAVDRHLLYLGWGTWIAADGEATQTWFGHHDASYAVGLGVQVNGPLGFRHSTFSVYDGPSWDTDPPHLAIGYNEKVFGESRQLMLNYVAVEEAIALSPDGKWDGIFRVYHRSGMFGVYSIGNDAGLTLALGIRYRF